MTSQFDKQLKKLLKGDVDDLVENLPDNESEEQQEPEEMMPVLYDEKETSNRLDNPDLQSDYEAARSNLYGLMGKSNAALELTLKIAMMSEHPRALEVAANLIKTSSDISKELLAIHKAIEEKRDKGEPPKGNYTQNNYYVNSKEEAEKVIDDLPDEDGT